jgi:hypothetical protein
MSTIQIPLIFDVSANGTVFGEDISGDAIKSHIKLNVSATKAQSTAFINAMKNVLFSDVSDNYSAANDASGVLFYKNGGSPENAIGDAIKNFFFDTSIIKHTGSTPSEMFGLAGIDGTNTKRYGIPYGIRQVQDSSSSIATADIHQTAFIDSDGTEFYKILLRIASTHLMGHPFSQGFIQENTIKTDLENCDLSGQIGSHFNLTNLVDVSSNGAASNRALTLDTSNPTTAPGKYLTDISANFSDGKQVGILQTIYEQLLVTNMSDMSGQDISGVDMSDDNYAHPQPLVFKKENTVSLYVRPRLFLKMDISGGIQSMNAAVGNALGISGTTLSSDNSGTSLEVFKSVFGVVSNNNIYSNGDASGYFWLAGRQQTNLSNWATNLSKGEDASGGAVAMLDAHVWKIDITLQTD